MDMEVQAFLVFAYEAFGYRGSWILLLAYENESLFFTAYGNASFF
jgi:hypothetical protein